jgi:hypothetical protein
MRVRRPPVAPLFALAFVDGTSWGQPYRPAIGRPMVRICGPHEARQTIVPRERLAVTRVELSARGLDLPPALVTLEAGDGTPLAAGAGPRSSRTGRFVASFAGGPVTLEPGRTYALHIRAAAATSRCARQRALVTDLPLGPPVGGVEVTAVHVTGDGGHTWRQHPETALSLTMVAGTDGGLETPGCGNGVLAPDEECDGRADGACPGRCSDVCTCAAPAPGCGDDRVDAGEECDGAADTACPGRCAASCTCTSPPPTCGDGRVDGGEACDGATDAACPGRCTPACACAEPPPPPPPPPPGRSYRSIYTSGYIRRYDASTTTLWPPKVTIMLGEANSEGPLVAPSRAAAMAAGNTDAKFGFYFSLTSLDSKCGCFDQRFYQTFAASHPEWLLRDSAGKPLSTFVYQLGEQRQFAVDIGNPAFIDAWADYAMQHMERYGWDAVWIDNILRGNFYGWSGWPINPRTRARYTAAEYRQDTLAALGRIRARFDSRGKMIIGNHAAAWEPDTFPDPVVQQQILTMQAVEIEDCVYTFGGQPHSESNWIAQVRYLEFANQNGILTQCRGGNGTLGDSSKRDYILASYLLTKRGLSNVAQLNSARMWWSGLEVDLGAPTGAFRCLDPAAGLATAASCPSAGKIYVRDWEKGRVLVNPTADRTVTVPLGRSFRRGSSTVTSVTLGPRSGVVLTNP